MKIRVILLVIILMGILNNLSAQSKLYRKLSKVDSVSSTSISGAIENLSTQSELYNKFSFVPDSITSLFFSRAMLEGLEVQAFAKDLDYIVMLTSKAKIAIAKLKLEMQQVENTYERLMNVKEEGSRTSFYILRAKNGIVRELIMFVEDSDEVMLVQLGGKIKNEDLQRLMKGTE